ncbi:hypothetical protein HK101_007843 [Irineochytrium annulatum]|nr:hypothetical protein HK101_007843 [Irineochytrium annulatum]
MAKALDPTPAGRTVLSVGRGPPGDEAVVAGLFARSCSASRRPFRRREFRKLLKAHVDEISDLKSKANMKPPPMEWERGDDIKWIKPQPGFVVMVGIETAGKDVTPEAEKVLINISHCAAVAEAKAEKVKRNCNPFDAYVFNIKNVPKFNKFLVQAASESVNRQFPGPSL